VHLVGPATRLSVGFFVPRTNAELVPKIHVHDSYPVLAKISLKNFFAKMQPSKRDQNFVSMLPFKHKMQPKCSVPFLCCMLPTVHLTFFNSQLLFLYFTANLSLAGQADTAWEPSEQQTF